MMKEEIKKMYLSDLKDGEKGVITKVKGYGAFRKRITEMGFIFGTTVKVIKKAPLQDPVEYELMGYRVSLRKSEAELIEIVSESEAKNLIETKFEGTIPEDIIQKVIKEKGKTINIALVGNPNCGKTTLFNYATGKHERVGNYGGVTVDLKTAHLSKNGYKINITDLPGTYSISEYSPEELYVRKHLMEEMPDVVINVIDASNIKRNMFLTTQLIDMNIKVIIALNMYDELEKKGDSFDFKTLGKMLGIPIVPTIAAKGKGIEELMEKSIELYEEKELDFRHIHINYGEKINQALENIKNEIKKNPEINDKFHPHYVAIKLLEDETSFTTFIAAIKDSENIIEKAKEEIIKIEKTFDDKASSIITDAKYAFIKGALKETYKHSKTHNEKVLNHAIDVILTHKWFGFPIFIFFMWLMFQLTFTLGSIPMDWIDMGVSKLGETVKNIMTEGALRDLIVDGIIGGVGGVIIFLPNILILFFCISLMEDTGYMARAAFIMDKVMHSIGLHGKSFIPLLMGFGCNVPAIMATRTLENRKDRILTMLIVPFMSCSARLPVYVLFISAFFPNKQGLVLLSIYIIGVLLAILTALFFKKTLFAKKEVPFVMELPPYRIPTIKNTTIHMWNKSVQYLNKMGTVILVASILIWALGYFPREVNYSTDYQAAINQIENNSTLSENIKEKEIQKIEISQEAERMEKSYIGQLGHFITPVISPLGYDWKIGVSIITGLAAKEIVVGSMGVLYQSDFEADETSVNLQTKLQEQTFTSGDKIGQKVFTPLVAYSLMLFILIYFPCVAVLAAIKREAGLKWAVFTMFYTTALAWIVAFLTYNIGSFFL